MFGSLRSCLAAFTRGSALLNGRRAEKARLLHPTAVVCGRRSAKIANRKGKEDMARAKLYGRIGKQIQQAVRSGGPSDSNATLQAVLNVARLNSIPRDLIERNIKKGADKGTADFTEVTYECYGQGGVGMVIEILTDKINRASATVRSVVTKCGGKMADPGSVLFSFQRRGFVVVSGGSEDDVTSAAIEAGADDVVPRAEGEGWEVVCEVSAWGTVVAALRDAGLPIVGDESGLRLVPLSRVDVPDDEVAEANEKLCESLLELDDVDSVTSNQADDEE